MDARNGIRAFANKRPGPGTLETTPLDIISLEINTPGTELQVFHYTPGGDGGRSRRTPRPSTTHYRRAPRACRMCLVSDETQSMPSPGEVASYLRGLTEADTPWEGSPAQAEVSFLARGEYSLNYRIDRNGSNGSYVARLVTGSQMGLALGDQALYEHRALDLIRASRVTPEPRFVDPDPPGLPYPVIVEDYLPGRPLDYAADLKAAARAIAAIHALPVPEDHGLKVLPDPVPAALEESRELAAPYLIWEDAPPRSRQALAAGIERLEEIGDSGDLFAAEDLAVVNYDLNTHNFVVEDGEARLLDWEKARLSPAVEDLAHFLLPTTTLWRDETAARLTPEQEREFVDEYVERAGTADRERFERQLEVASLAIALRAVSWCAWAQQAHFRKERPASEEMLDKAGKYLNPKFLRELLGLEEGEA